MQYITSLLDHYGYIILFSGLLLELIALPTPGELLMSYCGFLVYQGKLNWAASILISASGAAIGIIISYLLGLFLGLVVLVAGLVQDYLTNEFGQFDAIAGFLVESIFTNRGSGFMGFFIIITSPAALIYLTVLILIWIMLKGKNRLLEVRFLLIVILGGQLLQEGLGLVFHRLGPLTSYIIGNGKHTFPSEQAYMAVVGYGFATFMFLRHTNKGLLRPFTIIAALFVCLFSGLSEVYIQTQLPSDVAAGYVFGGVWLSLNIVLLEVFRVLPEVQNVKS